MNVKIPRNISILLLILILVITFLAVYSISLETQKSLKEGVQEKSGIRCIGNGVPG